MNSIFSARELRASIAQLLQVRAQLRNSETEVHEAREAVSPLIARNRSS